MKYYSVVFVIIGNTVEKPRPHVVSAAVLITDGSQILINHVTMNTYWDLPKGLIDGGESSRNAAVRELFEETGLRINANALIDCGVHCYKPHKNVHVWKYMTTNMPDPTKLKCTSVFHKYGKPLPEVDDHDVIDINDISYYMLPVMVNIIKKCMKLG